MRDALQNIRQGLCAFDDDAAGDAVEPALPGAPGPAVRHGSGGDAAWRRSCATTRRAASTGTASSTRCWRGGWTRRGAASPTSTSGGAPTAPRSRSRPPRCRAAGFVAVYTDVTERQRAAAALREANEALEARVAERTLALSAAKAEAERANLGKTRFLAAAGHDLLQPLQAARLFLSALAGAQRRAGGRADRRLARFGRAPARRAGRGLQARQRGDDSEHRRLPRSPTCSRPLGDEFSALAREHGLGFRAVRELGLGAQRPGAAPAHPAELPRQRAALHRQRPGAGRLPAARGGARRSRSGTPGRASRRPSCATSSWSSIGWRAAPTAATGLGSGSRSSSGWRG